MGFESISRGFETTIDTIIPLTVMANGAGDIATTFMPFSFSFSIDQDQDQDYGIPVFVDPDGSGSATAIAINASLADFQPFDPFLTGLPIYTYFTANTQTYAPRINPFMTTLSGSMQVNYWYTQEIEVADVPLPSAVWLFGSGLLGLVGVARRERTNRGATPDIARSHAPEGMHITEKGSVPLIPYSLYSFPLSFCSL